MDGSKLKINWIKMEIKIIQSFFLLYYLWNIMSFQHNDSGAGGAGDASHGNGYSNDGMLNMDERYPSTQKKRTTAYIAGCVRNCADHLEHVFLNIKRIAEKLDDFFIIISYDHSTDKSLDILNYYKSMRFFKNKMHIIVNTEPRLAYRTQNIARARNLVLSFVEKDYIVCDLVVNKDHTVENISIPKHPLFMWIDCDDVCSSRLDVDTLFGFFGREDWDVLTFNRPIYYDVWALSYEPFVVSCWAWGVNSRKIVYAMRDDIKEKLEKLEKNALMACNSAFNGFAVYRTEKMLGCVYDWKCEVLSKLHRESVNYCVRKYQCFPDMVKEDTEKEDCEHKSFHKQMREKNGARICISPVILFA
jgi:hypothetical protein